MRSCVHQTEDEAAAEHLTLLGSMSQGISHCHVRVTRSLQKKEKTLVGFKFSSRHLMGGDGGGRLNFSLPVPLAPVSALLLLAPAPLRFLDFEILRNGWQCCVIFSISPAPRPLCSRVLYISYPLFYRVPTPPVPLRHFGLGEQRRQRGKLRKVPREETSTFFLIQVGVHTN